MDKKAIWKKLRELEAEKNIYKIPALVFSEFLLRETINANLLYTKAKGKVTLPPKTKHTHNKDGLIRFG